MSHFNKVGGYRPGRSVFDLSHEVKLTCDMGQLIPVLCEETVPGDTFKIGNSIVARFAPLVAPIMHEVNVYVHYFFVPNRLTWADWEDFITGGDDGTIEKVLPTIPNAQPAGSVADYLGFPIGITFTGGDGPSMFPLYAYNKIYNDFYRDPNLIDEVSTGSGSIKNRAWEKDYFTSALPWQQRGTPVALPISGIGNAEWDFTTPENIGKLWFNSTNNPSEQIFGTRISNTKVVNINTDGQSSSAEENKKIDIRLDTSDEINLNDNEIDLSAATTFNVSDLRLAFQIQKFLERNARVGPRYIEQLRGHFGISPRDETLQRPVYIGGSKSRMIVSEVLQTSSTVEDSPQGTMAGHGITADATYCGSYTAKEYGIIMGIMSIMPRSLYMSQGIDRCWSRKTRYDYYWPEFANLSEQAILVKELYATENSAENNEIFGYQGRYDELRYRPSRVAGLMRTDLSFWHMGRLFSSKPALNKSFVECRPSKAVFAAPTEPACIVSVGNLVKAIRPLPIMSNPGMIDH